MTLRGPRVSKYEILRLSFGSFMIVFLGAGASAPFDFPTMPKLVHILWNHLSGNDKTLFKLLCASKNSGDTENVLMTIEQISSIANSPIAAIFKPYQLPPRIGRLALPRLNFETLVQSLRSLREHMYDEIFEVYQTKPMTRLNFELYSELFSIIGKKAESKGHLVFTTNYDTIIEDFCAATQRYELRDGFEHDTTIGRHLWSDLSFDRPVSYAPKPTIKLFKVHGSLGWKESIPYGIEKVTLEKRVESSPTSVHTRDLIIYPGSKNPPDRHPFTYLYDRFETEMKTADQCVVIGYSFRDDYLNRVFRNFIFSQQKRKRLYVISKTSEETLWKNLLGLKRKAALKHYVFSKMVIPIPCHFGENGWSKEITAKLQE